LPPGVNFINILRSCFLYERTLHSFSVLHFGFVIFWQKDIGEEIAHKMLMKLTPGLHSKLPFFPASFGFDFLRRIGFLPDVDPNSDFVDSDYFAKDERLVSNSWKFVVVVVARIAFEIQVPDVVKIFLILITVVVVEVAVTLKVHVEIGDGD